MLITPTRKMVIKPLATKEVQNVVMPHLHEGQFSVTVLLRNSRSKNVQREYSVSVYLLSSHPVYCS